MATHENLTPATLGSFFLMHLYGYPSNSGVPQQLWGSGEISLTGSLYLSLGLSLTLSHSHTHTLVLPLTHNHSTSLSFTLIHSNKNDRGKLPFLQTSRLPLIWMKARRVGVNFEKCTSTTSAFTLTKMIGENYLFLQTSRFPLMNESTTSAFTLTKMIGKNYLFCRDPGSH